MLNNLDVGKSGLASLVLVAALLIAVTAVLVVYFAHP
jgi:hypothetical protein